MSEEKKDSANKSEQMQYIYNMNYHYSLTTQ